MSIDESTTAKTALGSALASGLNTLSANETVTFTLYVKTILPLDSYVFWVNANLLTSGQIAAAIAMGGVTYPSTPPNSFTVQGSLHRTTSLIQEETRTASVNDLVFTSLTEITDFNYVNPYLMYVAKIDGVDYAFKKQTGYYIQADLYNYTGQALYSIMDTQLIETLTGFDTTDVIVSNSLPLWLALNSYFAVYPSFAVPQNTPPPYATIHIAPDDTNAIQSYPVIASNGSSYQLAKDTVKVTLYGTRNAEAINYLNYILNNSQTTDSFGMMNMPIIRDEKEKQIEFGILAQKKVITFEISYYQQNIAAIAQKLITSAFISLTP